MTVEVQPLGPPGLLLIKLKRFGDARGFFSETYNERSFRSAGVDCAFVQDNYSLSAEKGTVRGLHFQTPPFAQAKLIRVLRGSVMDVVVDLRRGSTSYGTHVSAELSAANWHQLFIPEGFAHGFCTLEPDTEIAYKVSSYYAPDADAGIVWNDPALGIKWPDFAGSQVSAKDAVLPKFDQLPHVFR